MYTVQYTVYTVHCTVYCVHCTLYIVHCMHCHSSNSFKLSIKRSFMIDFNLPSARGAVAARCRACYGKFELLIVLFINSRDK